MAVVSVSLPEDLLERLDGFADDHGYSGRSAVVRDAARSLLDEFEDEALEDARLVGTVTAIFDESGIEKEMIDLRHDYEDAVASNVHAHIGEEYCMELFVLEGSLDEIRDFVNDVRSTSEAVSITYSVDPIDDLA